jgi:pyruvate/2-oxoglutarate dehydrogenase complex dihydrolipoamide acyltransferase (E2) component
METFVAQIPVPSMGATVHELTLIDIEVEPGDVIEKGQKCAEFESDKSAFDFEAPCAGTVKKILVRAGDIVEANSAFIWIETDDTSQKHLEVSDDSTNGVDESSTQSVEPEPTVAPQSPAASKPIPRPVLHSTHSTGAIKWTPKALRMAREAGFESETITDISATGPGGRVSGDDVLAYLATRPAPAPASEPAAPASQDRETVCIAGIGFAVPKTVKTNKELLEKFPGKTEEEIVKTTGISQRHIAGEDDDVTTYAAKASEHAIAMAGIDVSAIDGIIMATIIPD